MKKTKTIIKDYGLIISLGLALLGIIMIFFPYNRLNGLYLGQYTIQIGRYNELGDFIGGITTPFLSIAAFTLLYLTYSNQKKELLESRIVLENQNVLINKQQFESTFFNMLNLHNQITDQLKSKFTNKTDKNSISISRNEPFFNLYETFRLLHHNHKTGESLLKNPIFPNKEDFIDAVYHSFLENVGFDFNHYYRNLFQIVQFIDNASIPNKTNYINILEAQLSTGEILLLFFYCLSRFGKENFKPLVEKYSLLKEIAENNELKRFDCKDFYDANAFNIRE